MDEHEIHQLGIADCQKCGLCEIRKKIVVSRGEGNLRLFIVGDAPGEFDDSTGVPLSGPAGEYLEASLRGLSLSPNDVFVTNLVKCRTPGDRPPHSSELRACRPYLRQQLAMQEPKVVLGLGLAVLKAFFPKHRYHSIRSALGKSFRHPDGYTFIPTYHPTFIVCNTGRRGYEGYDQRFIMDLKRALVLISPTAVG